MINLKTGFAWIDYMKLNTHTCINIHVRCVHTRREPHGVVFLQIPSGWLFLVTTQTVGLHLTRGTKPLLDGRMDGWACVSRSVTDLPWEVFGWIVRAGAQAFPTRGPGPEGNTWLLGQVSLPASPPELGPSTSHRLVPPASTTSFPPAHKRSIANTPWRPAERGSHTWKEDCFVLYLQQKVRKSKLLTIINNWAKKPQNSHKMTQEAGMCAGRRLLAVCSTVRHTLVPRQWRWSVASLH